MAARLTCLPSCCRIDYHNSLPGLVLNPFRLVMKELQGRRDPGNKSMDEVFLLPLFVPAPGMALGRNEAQNPPPCRAPRGFCARQGLGGAWGCG